MLVNRCVRFSGKGLMIGIGDFQRREIFGVHARWQQNKGAIGAVFNFEPHGLNVLLEEIDPEDFPRLLGADDSSRNPNPAAFLFLGTFAHLRVYNGGRFLKGGAGSHEKHRTNHKADYK